ncbi:tyrosine-type recombinase/integrase [Polaribacter sp. R2A056_3_33]|uniref:tyrosine-type recombinase/integrase n=1 Tax=Polaribacter sp. R2A056_3_33 TaxID=2745563 RepID=UPI001C4FC7C8|nr:tyrosine-type recombinase/integrase [Polaribacter sp. R2A056_3_33]QXP71953.1 tyrosine-type recombinase/integrase [Polaribacter sp. R2A056_3_33]
MASVNFLYRSTKEKSNLVLRLLYRYNDIDYVFGAKTKFEIEKTYWSKQHKKKSKDIEITNKQTDVNNELNKIENHVLKAFSSENIENINKEWLQTQIDNYYNPKEETNIPTDLISYIDFYLDYRKNEITETTKKKCRVIKNKLIKYEAFINKKILIKNINDSFKNEFVNYQKERMYSQNTIQREFVTIKTFCKHARYLGLETHHQLDGLRIEKQKVEKIYLTFEDLEKIENISKEKLTDSLDNVKDWLIISCYTGQRISDFMRFTDEQIRIENGKHLIEFTQKKTGKNMTVPLHPKVLEILNKRGGKFPYSISDQKYNDFIKDVCELAEINEPTKGSKLVETKKGSKIFRKQSGTYKKWELVTSHIGRRSFATNFYGKIPTTYLIYITGHSTETMFLNYIGKSNKDLALEITNYF